MDDSWIGFESLDDHGKENADGLSTFPLPAIRGFLVTER
jgi:hypothetical protein